MFGNEMEDRCIRDKLVNLLFLLSRFTLSFII